MMLQKNSSYIILKLYVGTLVMFIMMCLSAVSFARAGEQVEQNNFTSPQQAVEALINALRDNNDATLLSLFGPDSEDLISFGDKVANQNDKKSNQNDRKSFLQAYDEKHRLEMDKEGRAVLFVGSNDYPFPVPIVRQVKGWVFDTQAGKDEILNRRIGGNELRTIEVMEAYTAAQREYACMNRKGGGSEFAQKFISREGEKDGLYWETAEGEEDSPFGPLIARATKEGYRGGLDKEPPEPFYGYYFKILTQQGDHAKGGAFDYVVDGKMVLGFALVAYPAQYGASGIMTFIVNQEGIIYEKDFGENTVRIASAMTIFDPDETWNKYVEPDK